MNQLPEEICNKIFYFYAQHPLAIMIQERYKEGNSWRGFRVDFRHEWIGFPDYSEWYEDRIEIISHPFYCHKCDYIGSTCEIEGCGNKTCFCTRKRGYHFYHCCDECHPKVNFLRPTYCLECDNDRDRECEVYGCQNMTCICNFRDGCRYGYCCDSCHVMYNEQTNDW